MCRMVVGAIAFHLVLLVGTSHALSGGISYSGISQENLKVIVTYWLAEKHAIQSVAVEASAVRNKIPRRLNPRTDSALIAKRLRLNEQIPRIGWWLLAPVILVTPWLVFLRRRRRITFRMACVLGAALCAAVTVCLSFPAFSDNIWPGDRSYFDDYVYATGMSMSAPYPRNAGDIIVAYEKWSWGGEKRVVAYRDGHTTKISDQLFRQLVVDQQIRQPVD